MLKINPRTSLVLAATFLSVSCLPVMAQSLSGGAGNTQVGSFSNQQAQPTPTPPISLVIGEGPAAAGVAGGNGSAGVAVGTVSSGNRGTGYGVSTGIPGQLCGQLGDIPDAC